MNAIDHIETCVLNDLLASEPYFVESELDTIELLACEAWVHGFQVRQVERDILWDLMVGQ